MSSSTQGNALSSSPSRSIRIDIESARGSSHRVAHGEEPIHPRLSPTLTRTLDLNDAELLEHQRQMDVDSAISMQLSRARSSSVAVAPRTNFLPPQDSIPESLSASPKRYSMEDTTQYAFLNNGDLDPSSGFVDNIQSMQHSNPAHDTDLFATLSPQGQAESLHGLPVYQPVNFRSTFDFGLMENFAEEEKVKLGISSPRSPGGSSPALRPTPGPGLKDGDISLLQDLFVPADADGNILPDSSSARLRQRKLSLSNSARPRPRARGGKIGLFEGKAGAPPPSFLGPSAGETSRLSPLPSFDADRRAPGGSSHLPPPLYGHHTGHDRPYRFSFYSNALSATIHARSLSELPAEGQTFEELFSGINIHSGTTTDRDEAKSSNKFKPGEGSNGFKHRRELNGRDTQVDEELCTWWLDIMSPTDEEMKLLSKVFSIHPLTTEDIQMEETREKIELFRNYYLVCFRSFDQDPYSPTYLEPLNMYIVVFREGTLSFHFRPTPHPQNVRRRIKQLKDYISVSADWISYALIDDITDAFGPLIQNIEYEVDSIDELVLILKETEQSDMLRRIGTCRKKVMGLLRLMGNKADVVKGLAKRCNENWSVAPKSDIGLYLSDIQDHLITMTQNLNHYEKILSRSHSNYLAQISIEMTDANNQINDVLSKLTALGTVLIPMNLVTGLWGMNVHVPGQDDQTTYTWFVSIIAGLLAFACLGGYVTYRIMVGRR